MSAHTPGPWTAHLVRVQRCIHGSHGGPVAYTCGTERDDECDAANARLIAAAPDLLAACANARDMLATDRQEFVDCNRVQGSRTEDAVACGLVWVDEDTWIEPEDAEPLRDYDPAIALIDAAMAKAAGGAT